MIPILISLNIIVLLWLTIEIIILRRNRSAFEELILKFIELGQVLYNRMEAHDKKLSDNVNSLSKVVSSILSVKNEPKIINGAVSELQSITKILKVGITKELKDIDDGLKKIKTSLNQIKEK